MLSTLNIEHSTLNTEHRTEENSPTLTLGVQCAAGASFSARSRGKSVGPYEGRSARGGKARKSRGVIHKLLSGCCKHGNDDLRIRRLAERTTKGSMAACPWSRPAARETASGRPGESRHAARDTRRRQASRFVLHFFLRQSQIECSSFVNPYLFTARNSVSSRKA